MNIRRTLALRQGLLLAALMAFSLSCQPARAMSEGADLEIGGQGAGPGQFFEVRDITFDTQNNLYVLDGIFRNQQTKQIEGNGRVQKFDNTGKLLMQFSVRDPVIGDATDQYGIVQDEPQRLAVDSLGDVYVTKPGANRVEQYDPAGKLLKSIPIPEAMAITRWTHDGREQLAVLGSQRRVVKGHWTWLGGDHIDVLNTDGTVAAPIPLPKTLQEVQDITADRQGNLYALAAINQIYKFDASGKLLNVIGSGTRTRAEDGSEALHSVAVDSRGNIYTLAFGNPGMLVKFDSGLTTVTERGGQFHWADPWSTQSDYVPLAIDNEDRLWAGITDRNDPRDPNLKSRHFRPAVVRASADFFDPARNEVTQRSALLLGFKPAIATSLPYHIAYDLRPVPVDFVVAPSNRRMSQAVVKYQVYGMYKTVVGEGQFDLPLRDGAEARHSFTFTPPRFGWYHVVCDVLHDGKRLTSMGAHFGVTPRWPGMVSLAAGDSPGGWEDAPRQMFSGLPIMRLHASKGLDALDKNLTAAEKVGATVFVQLTDRKEDLTPEKVRPIIERFKDRVKYWELMNEPNFSMSPEDLAGHFKELYPLIKGIDPAAQVMGPAFVGLNLGWIQRFYAAGGGKVIDIFSNHDYEGHESIDPNHWRWKYGEVRKIMAQYGDADKPIWQTERAITGVRGGNFLGGAQAVRVTLHQDLMETLGIPNEHDSLYYLNQAGYSSVPSYLWSDAGPHPAALAMRTRYALTSALGRHYKQSLDFGPTGNKIFMGLRFDGPTGSTVVLRNLGTKDQPMDLAVRGAAALDVVDAFGNVQAIPVRRGSARLMVRQMPIYLRLHPGQEVTPPRLDFGEDLARSAAFSYSAESTKDFNLLNNGIWETFHDGNPNGGTDGKKIWTGKLPTTPQTLTITLPRPESISHILVAFPRADNAFCALLDYDLLYQKGEKWVTLRQVRTPVPASNPAITPDAAADTWYLDNNFDLQSFGPITTDKLRLVVHRSTHGFLPDDSVRAWGNLIPAQLMLKEIEIYGPGAR